MAKPFKFLCHACARSQTNKPRYDYCARCNADHAAMFKLGDLIRRARPQHERTPTALLLARFWEAYAKVHHPGADTTAATQLVAQLERGEQLELYK